jgi:hypothetical protein
MPTTNHVYGPYRILFYDPWTFRHEQFVVKVDGELANKYYPSISHAHSLKEFSSELAQLANKSIVKYEVIFLPTYTDHHVPKPAEERIMRNLIWRLCKLPSETRPKLIVFHGHSDEYGVIPALNSGGYKVVHQSFVDKIAR